MNLLNLFFAAICLAALVVSVVIPAPAATPTSGIDTYKSEHGESDLIASTDLEPTVTSSPTGRPDGCQPGYCENGTSYCWYWGGITGWDSAFNPVPGMVRTSIGTCATSTSEAVETA